MLFRQLVMVDAINHRQIGAVGRRRYKHALGPRFEVGFGLVLGGEDAGAFEGDVDPKLPMRQLGRIADRRHLDLLTVDDERVALDRDLTRKAAVNGIKAQEMRIGLDRAEIVDGHDLYVVAAGLDDGAQNVASDSAESVYR